MTMARELDGKKVAILVANDGIEQAELTEPRKALEDAGAETELVAPARGEARTMQHLDRAASFSVDRPLDDADPADYDALVLPGGVANPDALRTNRKAVAFVRAFAGAGKPIAPWMLVEADVVRGRTLTSWPSLQTDIRNAGGTWVDEEVHDDDGLVTSRKPADLPAFSQRMVEEFAKSGHARQAGPADAKPNRVRSG
jgi:protease I